MPPDYSIKKLFFRFKGVFHMNYNKSNKYDEKLIKEKIMGPNPIKLTEELLADCKIPSDSLIMDLGCGQGLTSVFLVKEYGFNVIAADLWSDPTDNKRFFDKIGLTSKQILAVHTDATEGFPFAHETFDGIVTVDSFHYFGRDYKILEEKIMPFVKNGGYVYISIPGMKKDCHDNLPEELLLSWTPQDLETMHDADYWYNIVSKCSNAEVVSVREMESNDEVWNDWLSCENPYAVGDRKSMNAGAGRYLNFIAIVLRKK